MRGFRNVGRCAVVGIGKARPLCCFCWLFCCAVAAYVILSLKTSFLCVALLVAVAIVAVLLIAAILNRKNRFRLLYFSFLAFAVLAGFATSLLHENLSVRPANDYAAAHADEITELRGLVVTIETESSYINAYGVRVDRSQGKQSMLYLSMTGERMFEVGDYIRVNAHVLPVTEAEEEPWRIRTLRADGYLLVAYADESSDAEVLSDGHTSYKQFFSAMQTKLAYRLKSEIGGEAGKLSAALLLGTRDDLSDLTVLDFRRAGASHLLALSGLHLSLIILMLGILLRAFRCPYRWRMLLLSGAAVVFLLVTGCSISTLRATFMLLCLHVSQLRGAPYDALTPLSVFFGLCLTVRPTWIYDAGLWLTVLATLAVIEIIPAVFRIQKEKRSSHPLARPLHFVWQHVVFPPIGSCIVLLVLIIPTAMLFGEVSLLSPVSNLVLTPLTAAILGLGLLALPLFYLSDIVSLFEPATDLVVKAIEWLSEIMLNVTASLSDVRGALVSLRYDFVPYLLLLLLAVFVFYLFFQWKKPIRFLWVAMGWAVLFGFCLLVTQGGSRQWELTYTKHGKNELVTLHQTDVTILCDVTDGSYTAYRDLFDSGLPDETTEIEALVLTHYHNRHISTVYQLLGDYRVREIWLPLTMPNATQDKATQDEGLARSIAAFAQTRRVEVHYYLPEEGARLTETLSLEKLYYSTIKRSTHPTIAMRWNYRGEQSQAGGRLVWLGASAWEGEYAQAIFDDIAACDALIISEHGPVIKSDFSVKYWVDEPSLVLFADGNVSTALIATPETAAALQKATLILAEPPHTKFDLP